MKGCQGPLLRQKTVRLYDFICIQEPNHNEKTNSTHMPAPAKNHFDLVYPQATDKDHPARACILVNKRIRRLNWHVVHLTRDHVTVALKTTKVDRLNPDHIFIHSVYNPNDEEDPGCPFANEFENCLTKLATLPGTKEHMAIGDFNLHHPLWGGQHVVADRDERIQPLLMIMEELPLETLLEPGLITRTGKGKDNKPQQSTIDLCLATPGLTERLTRCIIQEQLDFGSDHVPLEAIFDLRVPIGPTNREVWNWKSTDHQRLSTYFNEHVPQFTAWISNREALDQAVDQLVIALIGAIEASTTKQRLSLWSKPNWNSDCQEAVRKKHKLHRKMRRFQANNQVPPPELVRKHKKATKLVKKAIGSLGTATHRGNIEAACGDMKRIWKLARWARTQGTPYRAYTPDFVAPDGSHATLPEDKIQLLAGSFFPTPPDPDLSDLNGYVYPQPREFKVITEEEIRRAIKRASIGKAPGLDGIPNEILHTLIEPLGPILCNIFNASINLKYCPKHFRGSITVALKKPRKGDYTLPSSYRPIALLNTIGKIMESVLAERLSYLVETENVLPPNHFGGRRGQSTLSAIHNLLEQVYSAWERGETASLLMLDVSGAFDNVSHERLLHNLRKRGVSLQITEWICSFVKDRTTSLVIPEMTSDPISTPHGIPQGSPLSPILYLFYNADLLEITTDQELQATSSGWIDDVNILVTGDVITNCATLATLHNRAMEWAKRHASKFAHTKYTLIHFAKRHNDIQSLTLPNIEIPPSEVVKFLGLMMDKHLNWKQHLAYIEGIMTENLAALSSLASSTWGLTANELRQIVETCVMPLALYGVSAWYIPEGGYGFTTREKQALQKLGAIQKRGAQISTGTFRTTSAEAAVCEAAMLPVKQRLNKHLLNETARLMTLKKTANIIHTYRINHKLPQNRSPLEKAEQRLQRHVQLEMLENCKPFNCPTWWEPPKADIPGDALIAMIRHEAVTTVLNNLVYYTDGSAINERVGAAMVAWRQGLVKKAYLGTTQQCTVYSAELYGIVLALEHAREHTRTSTDAHITDIHIFTDNQSAIRAILQPRRPSGQYLIERIIDIYAQLAKRSVTLHWIPSHVGVPGNELADTHAKQATGWRPPPLPQQPPNPLTEQTTQLLSALKLSTHREAQHIWQREWTLAESLTARHLIKYKPTTKDTAIALYQQLSRPQGSIIAQVRSGKTSLNEYLFRIKRADSPGCDLCQQRNTNQNAAHIILSCPALTNLRHSYWPNGQPKDLQHMLNDVVQSRTIANFMIDSQTLSQFCHVTIPSRDGGSA